MPSKIKGHVLVSSFRALYPIRLNPRYSWQLRDRIPQRSPVYRTCCLLRRYTSPHTFHDLTNNTVLIWSVVRILRMQSLEFKSLYKKWEILWRNYAISRGNTKVPSFIPVTPENRNMGFLCGELGYVWSKKSFLSAWRTVIIIGTTCFK
jgi:hypothetical protein